LHQTVEDSQRHTFRIATRNWIMCGLLVVIAILPLLARR
jgi:hypothetical protein